MKKLLFTFAFLSFALTVFSQDFSIGPKVGISQANLNLSKDYFKSGDAKFGYHVGIFSRIGIGSFFLQPEVLYTQTKGKFSLDGMGTGDAGDYESSFNRIDIPLMVGFKFFKFLRLQGGPIASIDMNSELKNAFNDVQDVDFEKYTLGYQAGIGLDIGNLIVDAKYESALNKLTSNVGSLSTDQRVNQWILSVGFRIF